MRHLLADQLSPLKHNNQERWIFTDEMINWYIGDEVLQTRKNAIWLVIRALTTEREGKGSGAVRLGTALTRPAAQVSAQSLDEAVLVEAGVNDETPVTVPYSNSPIIR